MAGYANYAFADEGDVAIHSRLAGDAVGATKMDRPEDIEVNPKNGKVYRLRMKPVDGGKTLEVRGYIGPFYRNQTWIRVE